MDATDECTYCGKSASSLIRVLDSYHPICTSCIDKANEYRKA